MTGWVYGNADGFMCGMRMYSTRMNLFILMSMHM